MCVSLVSPSNLTNEPMAPLGDVRTTMKGSHDVVGVCKDDVQVICEEVEFEG